MTAVFALRLKSVFSWCLFLLILHVCLPDKAHAGYLDPGSGSILVQSIIASLAFFGRVTARVKGIFRLSR